MRIGAIDIGTNSMRLLVCDYIDNKILNQRKFINTTRIGKDVNEEGVISKEAIDRNIKALKAFYEISKKENCDEVYCIGTSALRDAKNGQEFILRAKNEIGIIVEIIDGNEESLLGFMGVLEGIEENEGILVVDIGGGSTELVFGNSLEIDFMKSENVGALRMTEKFISNDPILESEINNMETFIEDVMKDTLDILKSKNITKVVGIGGTITSLSAINQELEIYSTEMIHDSKIEQKEVDNILQKLIHMTLSDKKTLKGLQPKRADIITAGVVILNIIVKYLEIDEITVSEYDNLEGLICKNNKKMS